MGIKFLCPNGHKLNVKGFLRGKKAICPKCGTRVIVPDDDQSVPSAQNEAPASEESSGDVLVADPEPAGSQIAQRQPTAQSSVPTALPQNPPELPRPPAAAPPLALDPIDEAPDAVWYVRPATGGQYGPASGEIMRSWLNEGRVGASSLVWRAGWAEWRPAAATFPKLGASLSASGTVIASAQIPGGAGATVRANGTSPAVGAVLPVGQVVCNVATSLPPSGAASGISDSGPPLIGAPRKRRRRNDISVLACAVLVIVSIILVIIVVLVFRGQIQDEPEANEVHPPRKVSLVPAPRIGIEMATYRQ